MIEGIKVEKDQLWRDVRGTTHRVLSVNEAAGCARMVIGDADSVKLHAPFKVTFGALATMWTLVERG